MKLTTTKSKSIVSGVLIAASLAFTASTAMAATTHKAAAVTHVVHTRHVASAKRGPVGGYFGAGPGINVGQMVGAMLGMVPPQYAGIVQSAMRQAASHQSSGTYSSGTYDPSFDSPSTSTPIDNSASDAAAASAAAVSEQNLNDDTAMTASMAAAEQENDAANAAAVQTDINAGM
jgi:hypothetical protein